MPGDLDALYREVVLEHYRHPRNRQPLAQPDASALVDNPVCGDQVRVEIRQREGTLTEIAAITRGCSIAVASGSLMTQIALGADLAAVRAQRESLARLVEGGPADAQLDARLHPFARIVELPSRRRCALLPWEALEQSLASAAGSPAST
jgi:nitrogen fixation protein NifU and related proteins